MSKSNNDADAPARRAFAVVPDDNADFTTATRGLLVGTGGTLEALFADDNAPVSLVLGQGLYPFALRRIKSTGTTAANLVGLL